MCLLLLINSLYVHAQSNPAAIEKVLKQTKNRGELEKVIAHYKKSANPLKLKAAYFLIANMDIHSSYDIYWADKNGKKLAFNELNYPTMEAAVAAFNKLKAVTPGINPKQIITRDIDQITSAYLIDNIERAFTGWKSPYAKNLSFENFCEYLLPYRISVEPLQNWRKRYEDEFRSFYAQEKTQSIENLLTNLSAKRAGLFANSWNEDNTGRKEPLPRLGPLNLLLRKKGLCEDIAGLGVFSLRAMGIPASIDVVSYWATSYASHYFNVTFKNGIEPLAFDISNVNNNFNKTIIREPSKVIRTTYSKQPNLLASIVNKEQIPPGFLRTLNYKDVTKDYWPTTNISCAVEPKYTNEKIIYACIFNYSRWRPAWWGFNKQNLVNFNEMPKGVVYLPMAYQNAKLIPCGNPVALGYNNRLELNADLSQPKLISVKQQDKFLVFRPGKKYRLYYWKAGWKIIGERTANANTTELLFQNVPKNALLILIPEYSVGKERPFIISNSGDRIWF